MRASRASSVTGRVARLFVSNGLEKETTSFFCEGKKQNQGERDDDYKKERFFSVVSSFFFRSPKPGSAFLISLHQPSALHSFSPARSHALSLSMIHARAPKRQGVGGSVRFPTKKETPSTLLSPASHSAFLLSPFFSSLSLSLSLTLSLLSLFYPIPTHSLFSLSSP